MLLERNKLRPAQEIWEAALGELQVQVSKPNYNTWLKDTTGVSYQDNLLVIGAPNAFVIEGLKKSLLPLIAKTLASITSRDITVQFVITDTDQEALRSDLAHACQTDGGTSLKTRRATTPTGLNTKYTFDSFIVGEPNRLAYASALSVAENPRCAYNPLFVYGATGVGKTHLLHALGHITSTSGRSTLYVSAEQFTNEFIIAIKNGKTEDFRNKFRNINVLLIDDIQFLGGKVQTQECFFHTFDDLYHNDCQMVITSDRAPRAMASLESRLRSRFEWGLCTNILAPDLETRLNILGSKTKELKVSVSPEVLEFIAMQFKNNARELEGALNRVVTYARLTGTDLDKSTAAQALADIIPKTKRNNIAPGLIIDSVTSYFDLTREALTGKRRDHKTAMARQVAIYLMREEGNCRLAEIGKELGNRDHTTILHGYRRIAEEIGINPQLYELVDEIRQRVRGQ